MDKKANLKLAQKVLKNNGIKILLKDVDGCGEPYDGWLRFHVRGGLYYSVKLNPTYTSHEIQFYAYSDPKDCLVGY